MWEWSLSECGHCLNVGVVIVSECGSGHCLNVNVGVVIA